MPQLARVVSAEDGDLPTNRRRVAGPQNIRSMTLPRRMPSKAPLYRSSGRPVRPAPPPPTNNNPPRKPVRKAPPPPVIQEEKNNSVSMGLLSSQAHSRSTGSLNRSPVKSSSGSHEGPPPVPSTPRPSPRVSEIPQLTAVDEEEGDDIYEFPAGVSSNVPPPLPARRPSSSTLTPPSLPPLPKLPLPPLPPLSDKAPTPPLSLPPPSKPPIPLPKLIFEPVEEEGEYCELDDAMAEKLKYERTQQVLIPNSLPQLPSWTTKPNMKELEDSVYIEMTGHSNTKQHKEPDDYVEMTPAVRLEVDAVRKSLATTPGPPIPPKPAVFPKPPKSMKRLPKKVLSAPRVPPPTPPPSNPLHPLPNLPPLPRLPSTSSADDREVYIVTCIDESQEVYEFMNNSDPIGAVKTFKEEETQDIYESISEPAAAADDENIYD